MMAMHQGGMAPAPPAADSSLGAEDEEELPKGKGKKGRKGKKAKAAAIKVEKPLKRKRRKKRRQAARAENRAALEARYDAPDKPLGDPAQDQGDLLPRVTTPVGDVGRGRGRELEGAVIVTSGRAQVAALPETLERGVFIYAGPLLRLRHRSLSRDEREGERQAWLMKLPGYSARVSGRGARGHSRC